VKRRPLIRWSRLADRDLESAHAYLEERNPEAARRFAADSMFRKLLARFGVGAAASAPAKAAGLYAPYAEPHVNFLYNLLFCDDLALFQTEDAMKGGAPWVTLFADPPDYDALRKIAQDPYEESRLRALAYNRLRAAGQAVPAKTLLGAIVEVPLEQGLDVLAAYPDGRVRYLNQSGKVLAVWFQA